MYELVYCLLILGFGTSFLYVGWLLLEHFLKKKQCIAEIYWSMHIAVLFILVITVVGILYSFYIVLSPGQNLWGIVSKRMRIALTIVLGIWMIGMVVQVCGYIKEWADTKRLFRAVIPCEESVQERVCELAKNIGLKRKVSVNEGYGLITAVLGGVWKAVIYLPSDSYTKEQTDEILLHELYHARNGDRLIRRMLLFFDCVYWFNPLMKRWRKHLNWWDEFYCDLCVRESETVNGASYCQTLITMGKRALVRMKQLDKTKIKESGKIQFFEPKEPQHLLERVKIIMNYQRGKNVRMGLLAAMLVLIMITGSGVSLAAAVAVEQFNEWDLNHSVNGYEEVSDVQVEYVEYEASAAEFETGIVVGDIGTMALPNGTFSITLQNETWRSGGFTATKNDAIAVTVTLVPTDVTINMGIIEPDGTWRWINVSGTGSHQFVLDQTGEYHIFVRNKTSEKVDAYGGYSTSTVK